MNINKMLMPALNTVYSEIKSDANKYDRWLFQPGFWVSCSYRIRRLRKSKLIMTIFLPLDLLLGIIRFIVSDTKISSEILIGPGLYLPHPNRIIFNGMCVIGSNISIFQQVTIGEWWGKSPCIRDNTAIFGGAKIFGEIVVGENCKIGANTVINTDIPDNSSVSVQNIVIRTRFIK